MIVYQLENQPQEFSKIESPLKFQVRRLHDSIPTGKSTPRILKDQVAIKVPGKEGMIVYQLENQPHELLKIESPLKFQVRRGMIVYQLENQPQEFLKIESPLKFQVRRV